MKVELCAGSIMAARIASELPIDRIETCIALEQGGLTPSEAMVKWIQDTFHLEQHVLIRQRAGGFVYSYDEIIVMREQILNMKQLGIRGVVVGALTKNGDLDINALETWKQAAGNLDLTFHRAFDEVQDWKLVLEQLIKMGFKRILTSGQAPSVDTGMQRLSELVQLAAGRIEIMAGGGVRPSNIADLKSTGIDAIHFSGTSFELESEGSLFEARIQLPQKETIKAILETIKA